MLTSAFSVGVVWVNVLFVCWWDYYGTDSDIIVDLWEKGEDSVFRGAPHLVILTGPRGMGKHYVGRETHTIRMAYFELAAIPYNLGTVWAGFFLAAVQLWPPSRKAIGLEKGEEAMDAIRESTCRSRRKDPDTDPRNQGVDQPKSTSEKEMYWV